MGADRALIGDRIFRFEVIDSTNDYALEHFDVFHDGDVVMALEQRNGKGRHGRKWHSPRGGLWMSVIFKPRKIKDLGFYTKLASVSLATTLEKLGVSLLIKWPNDILVDQKKLAGILTEGIFEGKVPKVVVVGIGININNEIPDDLKEIATSFKEITGKSIPIDAFLDLYLKIMNSLREKYRNALGALTRVWKGKLDIREGQLLEYSSRQCKIERILTDSLVLDCGGERVKVYDIHR